MDEGKKKVDVSRIKMECAGRFSTSILKVESNEWFNPKIPFSFPFSAVSASQI